MSLTASAMFVDVVLTGFGGDWITKGSCYVCASPHDIARRSKCQCGVAAMPTLTRTGSGGSWTSGS